MFKTIVCIFIALCATESAFAQNSEDSANVAQAPTSYIVQLTEYRLDRPLKPSQTAADILKILSGKRDGENGKPVETIRFSTLSGNESMVQFGRRVNVTVSTTTANRGGTVRNMQAVDVGTLVRATVIPQNEKASISLTFESSRIAGDDNADSPPDINKTQISTSQLLELGKPTLVASSTTASTSVFVVKITRN